MINQTTGGTNMISFSKLLRQLAPAALAITAMLSPSFSGDARAQTIVKFATVDCEGDLIDCPYYAYTEIFNQVLEAGTNGRYALQVFPNSQLGDLESLTEQTARGIIQMTAGQNAGQLAGYYPSIQIVEMPYTFPSLEVGRAVMQGEFGQELSQAVAEASGIRIISWLPSAFRSFSNNVRPIKTPKDMEGLKIRVQPVPIHLAMVDALGASGTPIAWGELYNALQTGVVDGEENAPYVILLGHLEEVQKYYTLDNHLLNMPLVFINEEFYQGLSDEDREVFDRAARLATYSMLGIIAAKETQDLKKIAEAGVEIYSPTNEEFQQFVDATREPVRKVLEENVDAVWFDKLDKAIAAAKQ
jgi:TRAP-type transport system periplasmic protein